MSLILRGDPDHWPWPSGDTPGRLTGLRVGRAGPDWPLAGRNLRGLGTQRDPGDVLAKRTVLFPLLQRCRNGCSQLRRREDRSSGARARCTAEFAGCFARPPQGWVGLLGRPPRCQVLRVQEQRAVATPPYLCLLELDPPADLGVRFNAPVTRGYSGVTSAAQARSPRSRATHHTNSGAEWGCPQSRGPASALDPAVCITAGHPRPPGSQPEHPAAPRPGCFGPVGFPADCLARAARTRVPAYAHNERASAPPPVPRRTRHRAGAEPGPGRGAGRCPGRALGRSSRAGRPGSGRVCAAAVPPLRPRPAAPWVPCAAVPL